MKDFEQFLGRYKITRRDFNHAVVTLGSAFLAIEAIKALTPKKEDFGYIERISEETRLKLRQFNPVTIAHRGANTLDRLIESFDAGVDFAEADVRNSLGRLVITHEEELSLLVYDIFLRFFHLSRAVLNVEELVKRARARKQNLFLDLKEGSSNLTDRTIKSVYNNKLEFQVSYFGKKWQILDRVAQITGRVNNLFYSIGDTGDFRLFMDEQPKYKREGVALDMNLAQEEIVKILHHSGARVFVAVVRNSQEALKVLNSGIDGIISPNLSLLGVWSNRPPYRFLV